MAPARAGRRPSCASLARRCSPNGPPLSAAGAARARGEGADAVGPPPELRELGAEVLAERTFVVGGGGVEVAERGAERGAEPVEGEPGEVGVPAGQLVQQVELAVPQRPAEQLVERRELRP